MRRLIKRFMPKKLHAWYRYLYGWYEHWYGRYNRRMSRRQRQDNYLKKPNLENCCVRVDPDIEVFVASYGGCVSSTFITYVGSYKKVNPRWGSNWSKHTLTPPVSTNPNLKLIYLFDDPIASVLSIFCNNLQSWHYNYITSGWYAVLCHSLYKKHTKNLDTYLASGMGTLPIDKQFNNWYTQPTMHPILFVRSSTMWDHLDTIADYLDLPQQAMADFPEKRARTPKKVSEKQMKQLEEIYKDFTDQVNNMPDIYLRQPNWFGQQNTKPSSTN